MNHFKYSTVPSAARFKQDSSVAFAVRKDDRILAHLDFLLERHDHYGRDLDFNKCRVILCDLFLTANYWIKCFHEKSPRMRKERYPAVLALFEVSIEELCQPWHFDVKKPTWVPLSDGPDCRAWRSSSNKAQWVAGRIQEIYSLKLDAHGEYIDQTVGAARYFDKMQRRIYRLRFSGGRAYQYQWWRKHWQFELVPAESKRAEAAIARMGDDGEKSPASKGYGGFVMTLDRELYMAKHKLGGEGMRDGIFHSSYTAGEPVVMAGTMLIRNGYIQAVRCDSGHYKPGSINCALLLQGLGMFGVNLRKVAVYDFKGGELGTAFDLLKSNMSWDKLKARIPQQQAPQQAAPPPPVLSRENPSGTVTYFSP